MNGSPASFFRIPVLVGLALLIANDALGGPVRYGLSQVGLVELAYAPILAAGAVVLAYLAAQLGCLRFDAAAGFIVLLSLVWLPYALIQGRAPVQALFAYYTWIPLFLGLLAVATGGIGTALAMVGLVWSVAVLGVLLNAVLEFPWVGAGYEIMGVRTQFARAWSAFGIQRLPGFSRASFTAANQIAIGCALLLAGRFGGVTKGAIWILSVVAVWLTTSKAPLVAVLMAPAILFVHDRAGRTSRSRYLASGWVLGGLLVVAIGLPVLALLGARLPQSGHLGFLSFSSVGMRMADMWPRALALLDPPWPHILLGLGFGGIGVGQAYFDPAQYNAADNLFVFLFTTFGLGSLLFLPAFLRNNGLLARSRPQLYREVYVAAAVLLVIGTMSNVVESVVPAFLLGLLIGKAVDPLAAIGLAHRQGLLVARHPVTAGSRPGAFSGEAVAGSGEENAIQQKARAVQRFQEVTNGPRG